MYLTYLLNLVIDNLKAQNIPFNYTANIRFIFDDKKRIVLAAKWAYIITDMVNFNKKKKKKKMGKYEYISRSTI